ncbi:lipocalin-like domain-containing protein [Robiginitalea aurantiaca]|uniref:Lipocalin-like domain-containing protein n=1 Tax=Robiginitalea aurantiaca TaxID=3056915 RepID=A0ABT7WDV8_9FLAO|nr:lipocalin-like domain-containing protein [Robiginitalea aurantiaca]MDM9631099.1 lipocalin-like domain-containing protein [Robiginitalea aurantiaca]
MKNLLLTLLMLFVIAACAEKKEAPAEIEIIEEPTLEGAWEVSQMIWQSPDTTIYTKPYKSIFIFTDKHYSMEVATEDRPSWPSLKEGEERSDEDIRNAYSGLISNSGTYEVVGDSLIQYAIVAKSPNYMNDAPRSSKLLTIEKDSIYFTRTFENGTRIEVLKRMD